MCNWDLIFSGVVAVSTIIYAILTWKLVSETRKTREFQTTPDISIFLEEAEAEIRHVYIVIENIGYGTAKNAKFQIMKNFLYYDYDYQNLITKGIFINGLSLFYPKQRYRYLISDMHQNYNEKYKDYIELEISYEDILENKYIKNVRLNFSDIVGTTQLTPPVTYKGRIAYELGEIKKILKEKAQSK